MFASGLEFKAEFAPNGHCGVVDKRPHRMIKANKRRPRTCPNPKVSSDCNASPNSFSRLSQILSEYNPPSGEEQIQPGVADEEGSCTSTERGALDSSDSKQNMETNQQSTTNSLQLMMVSRILRGIPQSPHFYHLRKFSAHTRQALISAWDRVFEETVDQIQTLQANDFWVNAGELWKTMGELQNMGYNVIPLRRRIVELSDAVSDVKLSKLEMKRLIIKAENHRAEKSRLEFVIKNLQDKMRKEEEDMNKALTKAAEMENEMPNVDVMFANIFRKPLTLFLNN